MNWIPINKRNLSREQKSAIHKLWRRADLRFLLHPGQLKLKSFIDSNNQLINCVCFSRQYGKTSFAVIDAIEYALKHKQSNIMFVTWFSTSMIQAVKNILNQILSTCPRDIIPDIKEGGAKIVFQNGSTITFKGLYPDPGKHRGGTYNRIYVDECREIESLNDILESVLIPTTNTISNAKILLISTPPSSPGHDFTSIYIKDAIAKNCFYIADYKTNPFLQDPDKLQQIISTYKGGTNSITWKREQEADYSIADLDKLVIKSFNEKENEIEYKKYVNMPKGTLRGLTSIDLGNKDSTAVIVGMYDERNDVLCIERCEYLTNPTTREIADLIKKLEHDVWGHPGVIVDKTIQRITDVDHKFVNDLYADYNIFVQVVRKYKRNESMLGKLDDSLGKHAILINPECKGLIFEITCGVWNTSGKDYVRLTDGNHLDGLSALKYMEISLERRPIIGVQNQKINILPSHINCDLEPKQSIINKYNKPIRNPFINPFLQD